MTSVADAYDLDDVSRHDVVHHDAVTQCHTTTYRRRQLRRRHGVSTGGPPRRQTSFSKAAVPGDHWTEHGSTAENVEVAPSDVEFGDLSSHCCDEDAA